MKKIIIAYCISLITLLCIDGLWLSMMSKRFYVPLLGDHLAKNIKLMPIILFYAVYALGVVIFVVTPAAQYSYSLLKTIGLGGLLGLVAYGAYDFTNHATLQNWSITLTVVDLFWGVTVTALTSIITKKIISFF